MAKHPERFFTYWAFVAHALYGLGVFPSTFLLSVFVLIGSIFHNCNTKKHYNLPIDMLHHVLPFATFLLLFYLRVIPFRITWKEIVLPFALCAVYLASVGGINTCLHYYTDHPYYFHND